MTYRITLAPQAVEDFRSLRPFDRAAVRDAINRHLVHEPTRLSRNRIKRLRGIDRPQYRLRVGDVRVFYDVRDDEVEILGITPKPDAEAWLEGWSEEP